MALCSRCGVGNRRRGQFGLSSLPSDPFGKPVWKAGEAAPTRETRLLIGAGGGGGAEVR